MFATGLIFGLLLGLFLGLALGRSPDPELADENTRLRERIDDDG